MAQNDLKYKVGIEVDGVNVVHAAVSTMKDLGDATTETGKKSKSLDEFSKKFDSISESSKPMKRQLTEIKKILGEMEFNGMAGTEEFQRMSEYAGQLSDAIGDASANVKYFADDTRHLQIALVNGVQSVANVLNKDSNLIIGVKNMQRKISIMLEKQQTAATVAGTSATVAQTVATKALNAVMKANPIGLVITAITTLIGLFAIFTDKTGEATTEMGKLEDGSNDLNTALGRQMQANEEAGKSAGELTSKYEVLRMKYLACRNEMEIDQFIRANANGFKSLGIEVKNAADAMATFVTKAPAMRAALLQISVAKGMQKAMEDYTSQWAVNNAQNPITLPTVYNGMRFRATKSMSGGYNNLPDWFKAAGITDDMITNWDTQTQTAELTGQGLSFARQYIASEKVRQEGERQSEFNQIIQQLMDAWMEAERRAEDMARGVGIKYFNGEIIEPGNAPSGSTSSAKPASRGSSTYAPATSTKAEKPKPAKEIKKELDERLTELQKLQKEREKVVQDLSNSNLTPLERHNLEQKRDELDEQIKNYQEWTDEMMHVKDLPDNYFVVPIEFTIDKKRSEKNIADGAKDIDYAHVTPLDISTMLSKEQRKRVANADEVRQNAENSIGDIRNWLDMGAIGKEKAQELIDALNMQLESMGLKPIPVNIDLEDSQKKLGQLRDAFGPMSDLARGAGEAFKAFGDDTAEGIAKMGVAVFDGIGKIISTVIANQALALSEGVAGASKLPFPANIGAIATITGVILSTFAQIMSIAGSFATGGIVGGNSVSGDKLFARVNSGEMILNKLQQQRLFGMLNGTAPYRTSGNITPNIDRLRANSGGTMQFEIQGRKLVGVLANETRISGRSGRRTNIKI